MNRGITLAGYVFLAAVLVVQEISARHARRKHPGRSLTFAEFVAVVRLSPFRWLLLTGWLWLGWHLFARVHWR